MGEERTSISAKLNGKKLMIIGAVLFILIALIMGISIYNIPANRLSRQLDLGNRYLEEQNYEQSIVEFDKAIAIDPMSVEAYLGKADAYVGLGDVQSALDTLQIGYNLTGDERLEEKLDEVQTQLEENNRPEKAAQPVEEDEVQEEQDYIELPFNFSDITLMGYNLLEPHFDEIVSAFGCPVTDSIYEHTDTSYGYMSASSGENNGVHIGVDLYNDFDYTGFNSGSLHYSYRKNTGDDRYKLTLALYGDESSSFFDSIMSVYEIPVKIGDTYEECYEKLGVDRIKNVADNFYNSDRSHDGSLANAYFLDDCTGEVVKVQSIGYSEVFSLEGQREGFDVGVIYDDSHGWSIHIQCQDEIVEDVYIEYWWR